MEWYDDRESDISILQWGAEDHTRWMGADVNILRTYTKTQNTAGDFGLTRAVEEEWEEVQLEEDEPYACEERVRRQDGTEHMR
eukprot:5771329-Pyramimonas_sp.AAC.1